jgi:hypothetical protein
MVHGGNLQSARCHSQQGAGYPAGPLSAAGSKGGPQGGLRRPSGRRLGSRPQGASRCSRHRLRLGGCMAAGYAAPACETQRPALLYCRRCGRAAGMVCGAPGTACMRLTSGPRFESTCQRRTVRVRCMLARLPRGFWPQPRARNVRRASRGRKHDARASTAISRLQTFTVHTPAHLNRAYAAEWG